ncbi:hypothetical protein [Lacrimispora celerecrescens]|uniref:hypothetical protein n=1 Tax=Lacrimispora celerecrescens TaxID=29354 RepID=UPI0012FDFA7C|nr:hypothetical protein [Lacrimispora celerecrescens]
MIEGYFDNPIVRYINDVISVNQNKRIIIYGCGSAGSRIYAYLTAIGYEIAYFVDMDEKKQGNLFFERPVKSPYDLLYESDKSLIFLCIIDNAASAIQILKSIGLQENIDYYNIMNFWGGKKRYDLYDPICGYSRRGDLDGFNIRGDQKSKNIIVILGGSTTDDDYSVFTPWVQYFYEMLKIEYNDDLLLYNGAVSGYESSQELLKFLRDVIWLEPSIVIQFNGVNEVDVDKKHPLVNRYLQYICRNTFSNIIDSDVANAPKMGLRSADNLELSFGLEVNAEKHQNWMINMRVMGAVCREFGIKYYGILQPTSMFGEHKDKCIKKINKIQMKYGNSKLEERREFYKNVNHNWKQVDFLYNFSRIFDNVEGALYFDEVHYTEKANKIIAETIFDLLSKDIVRK